MNHRIIIATVFVAVLFTQSCTKELSNPVIPNQEELITTLKYTLISDDFSDTASFSFTDVDGPGGNNPVIVESVLKSNTYYIGKLELLNEQINPPEDITVEIEDEAEDHQFFFQSTINQNLNIAYNDADLNGNPIGISTLLQTKNPSSGKLTITLRHMPDKFANGVKQGNIANAGGETDIEITFDVEIQ